MQDITQQVPVTYRMPVKGLDPYFGFSRPYYYQGEQRGYWKLIHLKGEGKKRGITLVPYAEVLAFVRKQQGRK